MSQLNQMTGAHSCHVILGPEEGEFNRTLTPEVWRRGIQGSSVPGVIDIYLNLNFLCLFALFCQILFRPLTLAIISTPCICKLSISLTLFFQYMCCYFSIWSTPLGASPSLLCPALPWETGLHIPYPLLPYPLVSNGVGSSHVKH